MLRSISFVSVLLLTASLLAACPRKPSTARQSKSAARPRPVDLSRLAKEYDPGPLTAISELAPSFLLQADQGDEDSKTSEAIRRWTGTSFDFDISDPHKVELLLTDLLRITRQKRCDLACRTAALKMFDVLNQKQLRGKTSLLRRSLLEQVKKLGRSRQQKSALMRFMAYLIDTADLYHRHYAVGILRDAPRRPEATRALGQLANVASQREDSARALELLELARAARSVPPRDPYWLKRAHICYRLLNLACGDAALKKAADTDDALELRRMVKQLRRAEKSSTLQAKIERAHLMVDLSRLSAAERQFEQLAAKYPNDARPLVGLARVVLKRSLDMHRAGEILDDARQKSNKGQRFYELALGTWPTRALHRFFPVATADPKQAEKLLEPLISRVEKDAAGLARYDLRRAAIIRFIARTGSKALALSKKKLPDEQWRAAKNALASQALQRVEQLQRAYPKSPLVYQAAVVTGRFVDDPKRAYAIATDSVPHKVEKDLRYARVRATLLYIVAATTMEPTHISAAVRALDHLPEGKMTENLRAEVLALQARAAGTAARWRRVEEAYRGLADRFASLGQRARILNNIGVALYHQGKGDQAKKMWQKSQRLGPKVQVPRYNLLVSSPNAQPTKIERLSRLALQARGDALSHRALQAAARLAGLSTKEVGAYRKELRRRGARRAVGFVGRSRPAVLMDSNFYAGFGYSTNKGLVVNLDLSQVSWLPLPPRLVERGESRGRILRHIRVSGARYLSRTKVRRLLSYLPFTQPPKHQDIEKRCQRLQAIYGKLGFCAAKVSCRLHGTGRVVDLEVRIREGKPHKVAEVQLVGVRTFDEAKLRRAIVTRQGATYPCDAQTNRSRLKADQARLRTTLVAHGYLQAKVQPPIFKKAPAGAKVTFQVSEGLRARFGEPTFKGKKPDPPVELRRLMQIDKGAWFNREALARAIQRLTHHCRAKLDSTCRVQLEGFKTRDEHIDFVVEFK